MSIDITQLARDDPIVHMRVGNEVLIRADTVSSNFMNLACEHRSVYMGHVTMVAVRFKLDLLDGDVPSIPL